MDNKVYYGEYTLRHWIKLILKENITIPKYQRYFVWSEDKAKNLIKTLKMKQFVPPVTIGAFKIDGGNKNLILDGQQRLTSILLAYLGRYPDANKYKIEIERIANENDDSEDEADNLDNALEWNFMSLTSRGNNKDEILSALPNASYKNVDFEIDDDFLDKTFLGFSYIVPGTAEGKAQQKYYSSVFRNINAQGQALLPQESRASLYYLNKDLVDLFKPEGLKYISVKSLSVENKLDFVRYLSLLSQYKFETKASSVASGYKSIMEKYYEEYIHSAVSDEDSRIFGKFSAIFPNGNYLARLQNLETTVKKILPDGKFSSIIAMDAYLFGLIYSVLIKDKKIPDGEIEAIKAKIETLISEYRADFGHAKSPSNLSNLRSRIRESIEVYEQHES
jgi:hypothetical protein